MLKRAGYQVIAVTGPREAMEVVRSEAPSLILMDMNFTLSTSGEEGLTLLKQVKVFRPDVPVILMTAWGSIQLAVQGMQAGAFDFITKPWNNAALLQRIETALELTATPKDTPQEQSGTLKPEPYHRQKPWVEGGIEYGGTYCSYQCSRIDHG